MKRTCDRCIVEKFNDGHDEICHLGYKRKLVRISKGTSLFLEPAEECPKPKTWGMYFNTERKTK